MNKVLICRSRISQLYFKYSFDLWSAAEDIMAYSLVNNPPQKIITFT